MWEKRPFCCCSLKNHCDQSVIFILQEFHISLQIAVPTTHPPTKKNPSSSSTTAPKTIHQTKANQFKYLIWPIPTCTILNIDLFPNFIDNFFPSKKKKVWQTKKTKHCSPGSLVQNKTSPPPPTPHVHNHSHKRTIFV